ncbi:MAG: hypothetical protein WAU89_23260 [Candidatus Acidiferrales bacterium]
MEDDVVLQWIAETRALQAEAFSLAASQCHGGYGDNHGNWRCKYQDDLAKLTEQNRVLVERLENFRIAMDCRNRQWNKGRATCLEVGAKGSYKCEQCELIEDDDRTALASAQVNK